MEKSRHAFEQLVKYSDDTQFIDFFISITANNGDFKGAIEFFDKYFGEMAIENIDMRFFSVHILHLLNILDKDRLQKYRKKYKNAKKALKIINKAIEKVENDLTIIDYVSIDKEMVIKACQFCSKIMASKGNFKTETNFVAYEPNEDIIIKVQSYDFDEKIADELYEEWLDVAIDYQGDDFAEFSRVLFEFVPLKEKS